MIDKFRNTGMPLLEILADPNSIFMQGLAKFQRRTLYANIVNDRSAVYYTTSISKIDPFTKLDKIQVNYLDGYEDIIVDPNSPLEIPEKSNATFSSRLLKGTRKTIRRIPFLIALVAYVPLGMCHSAGEFRHGGAEEQPENPPVRARAVFHPTGYLPRPAPDRRYSRGG